MRLGRAVPGPIWARARTSVTAGPLNLDRPSVLADNCDVMCSRISLPYGFFGAITSPDQMAHRHSDANYGQSLGGNSQMPSLWLGPERHGKDTGPNTDKDSVMIVSALACPLGLDITTKPP